MKGRRQAPTLRKPLARLRVYVTAVAVMWTLVVAVSLLSNLRQGRQGMLEVARETARTAYEKDIDYRRWNAQHGGVYVPITKEIQPNPYLQAVTDRPIEIQVYPSSGLTGQEPLALTLINPAYMTRQVHELSERYHGLRGHITSLDPIRPANAPDPWERAALHSFEGGVTEVSELQAVDGVPSMRLMRPLITEEGCLSCHAEQVYEVGDVRGGISVAVPMTMLQSAAQEHARVTWWGHGILWFVGLGIIGGGGRALQQSVNTLQESEVRYRSLIRAVRAAIVVHDADGRIVTTNPAAQRILGLSEGQLAGRATWDEGWHFVQEDGSALPVEAYPVAQVFATAQPVRDRVIGVPDGDGGETVWALVNADPVFGEAGEIDQVIVTFMDITARLRAEQEVVRQRDLLETTLESLTYPFFVLNADDYTIEMANSASVPAEGLVPGLTCYGLTHRAESPCHSSDHPCPLDQVKASGRPAKVEHVHYTPDGAPRYVEVYAYPIVDDAGNVIRMIEYTLDITERRKAQKDLAEKTAALARSNAELEEFAYIASHDLQEPLRKVQAFGDRLQSRYGDRLEDRGRDYLDRMQNAASRMRNLIDDLLTYSRITTKAKPFELVDLNDVVEGVVADLVVRIEETGGRVEVGELPTLDADRIQMRRVFQNLIGNALKFHRDGVPPVVRVYAGGVTAEDDPVLKDAASEGLCRIAVEDNGIGFDMAYVKQVFAPFQRLHGCVEYEGTGMGLAICRKIVARHGGDLTVESEPGRGATFILELPIKQSEGEGAYDG